MASARLFPFAREKRELKAGKQEIGIGSTDSSGNWLKAKYANPYQSLNSRNYFRDIPKKNPAWAPFVDQSINSQVGPLILSLRLAKPAGTHNECESQKYHHTSAVRNERTILAGNAEERKFPAHRFRNFALAVKRRRYPLRNRDATTFINSITICRM